MKKIAMFGGSFNPVHIGHVKLLRRMHEEFLIDRIYVIPTFSTPLKDNTPMISAEHRFTMCSLAFADMDSVEVSDIEIKRQGRSYTSDTIDVLSQIHPNCEICLMVGADSFMQLPLWHNVKHIFESATILTISRGEYDADDLFKKKAEYEQNYNAKIRIIEEPVAMVSSTQVRALIESEEEFSHLLPSRVSEYIKENGLYGYGY